MTLPVANLTGTIPFAWFFYLDVLGDPVRATTIPGGYTFAASQTGDAQLNGKTFFYIPSELLEVGDVTHTRGGADSLVATLSGISGPNDALLSTLANRSNWQGRIGRLWYATNAPGVLTISGYYTGYMMQAPLEGDPTGGSRVSVTLENYQALLSQARNRTYQDQGEHDAGDVSAARIRASANGVTGTGITSSGAVGGGVGGSVSVALAKGLYAREAF